MILFLLKVVPVLFLGGVATSFAEYKFKYNLYEFLKEKLSKKKS